MDFAEVIFVTTPGNRSPQMISDQIEIAAQSYGGITHPKVLGCMINKVGAPVDQYGNARIDLFDPVKQDTGVLDIREATKSTEGDLEGHEHARDSTRAFDERVDLIFTGLTEKLERHVDVVARNPSPWRILDGDRSDGRRERILHGVTEVDGKKESHAGSVSRSRLAGHGLIVPSPP